MAISGVGTPSSGSVQSLGDGYFLVDGKKLNLQDLIMNIGVQMKATNDQNLATKYGEIKDKLATQQKMNDTLQMLNTYAKYFDSDGKYKGGGPGSKNSDTSMKLSDADMKVWKDQYRQLLKDVGVKDGSGGAQGIGSDGIFTKAELDTVIEGLKGKLQSMSTQNELDMMDLNKLNSLNTSCVQLLKSGMDEAKSAMQASAR